MLEIPNSAHIIFNLKVGQGEHFHFLESILGIMTNVSRARISRVSFKTILLFDKRTEQLKSHYKLNYSFLAHSLSTELYSSLQNKPVEIQTKIQYILLVFHEF